jgi:hypothetical protein
MAYFEIQVCAGFKKTAARNIEKPRKSGASEELPFDPQDRDAHEESPFAERAAAAESGRRARGVQLHHHCV